MHSTTIYLQSCFRRQIFSIDQQFDDLNIVCFQCIHNCLHSRYKIAMDINDLQTKSTE